METIKNYLESMFASMPNTAEVRKAKNELLQMMEDKYNELLEEGLSENAAVGTVISEFGNLDELAESLGLSKEVEAVHERSKEQPRRFVNMQEIQNYLDAQKKRAFLVALGVFLCICCVLPCVITDLAAFEPYEKYGVVAMFLLIAIAVGLFVYSGSQGSEWHFLHKELCQIDLATAEMTRSMKSNFQSFRTLALSIGCMFCVVSFIPALISDGAYNYFSSILFFLFIAMAVFLFVYTGIITRSYLTVLRINDQQTISGEYGSSPEDNVHYINRTAEFIMEVYWTTITCLYLILSFLSGNWGTTWLIWILAGIIHKILKIAFTKESSYEE